MDERDVTKEVEARVAQPSKWAERMMALGGLTAFVSAAAAPRFALVSLVALVAGSLWMIGSRRVVPRRLRLDRERLSPHDVRGAELSIERRGRRLRLRGKDGDVRLELAVESREDARAWLHRLGMGVGNTIELAIDPRRSALSGAEARRWTWTSIAVAGFSAWMFLTQAQGTLVGTLLAFAATGTWAYTAWRRPSGTIRVGEDGIVEERGSSSRFHPFSDVERVELLGDQVVLVLRGVGRVPLWVSRRSDASIHRHIVFDMIEAALGKFRERESESASIQRLMERAADSTVDDIERGAAYRIPALTRDELRSVLDNPASPAGARVAAARVLASSAEDAARLRDVASRTAHPAVRVALEEITDPVGSVTGDGMHVVEDEVARAGARKRR